MSPEERKKKIATIKALLAMTVANGASEAEMNFALGRAKKMMDELDIDATDLAFGGEEVRVETVVKPDFDKIRYGLCRPVGDFCHCATWREGRRHSSDTINYCGLESEVVFAHWMLDMLADFVLYSVVRYGEQKHTRLTRHERASFIVGCTARIAQRLEELTPKPSPGNGRDLIVVRSQLIEKHMQEVGIHLRDPFRLISADPDAYDAGKRAGDDARFNRPIDGMEAVRQLR